ncbi:hypothetical protein GCM10009676_21350 [Prauserella halophila]|uniref:DUF2537 domain-containing protein n=1 Tax=Prauserella halophila TaxID=185641 RepID=A0ABN1W5Y4_9PSEU|nr:DUF2537 domain-containing protein [Prauserella halophila]MCP2235672.1 Protein of unknown function (DUF2537) [Prauserella halophila]
MYGAELELDVREGRAVLTGAGGREADPAVLSLGHQLTEALHEWARVSAVVGAAAPRGTDPAGAGPGTAGDTGAAGDTADSGAVVAQRGRQLAGRIAAALGVTVSYRDPVAGRTFVAVPPADEPTGAGNAGAGVTGDRDTGDRGTGDRGTGDRGTGAGNAGEDGPTRTGAGGTRRGNGRFDALAEWWRVQAEQSPGPVPWGTGVLAGAFFAVVMVVAMLALAGALASATHGLVAVAAALVVSAGLAPSLWLGRRVPVVRWIVGGVAAGIALAWIGVLVIAW